MLHWRGYPATIGVPPMTERAKQDQQTPAPKPSVELTESDLDKVSGGVTKTPPKTSTPPSGPIPIPYPNQGQGQGQG